MLARGPAPVLDLGSFWNQGLGQARTPSIGQTHISIGHGFTESTNAFFFVRGDPPGLTWGATKTGYTLQIPKPSPFYEVSAKAI